MKSTTKAENCVVEKRAKYERFSMTVCANGVVNVRNDSYGDDCGGHIYSVNPEEGSCTCPHATYANTRCKHQTAVENRPIVVSTANAASATYKPIATDGGLPEITHQYESEEVGGERYARCEGCGGESIFGESHILHDHECEHFGRQEPTRSEKPDFGGGESTGVVEL